MFIYKNYFLINTKNNSNMAKSHLFFLTFSIFHIISSSIDSSLCPIDFNYVQTFPWDTSLCRSPIANSCCQTLRSLFGMGLSQHLRDTSNFYLPNTSTATSCFSIFQSRLATSLSVSGPHVSACLNNTRDYVASPLDCAGIATVRDWAERAGPVTELDASCNADLTGLTRCSSCLDAGMRVTSRLVALSPNSTKCFYYTVIYAAGIVNDFGPQDVRTAACVLGLPLAKSATINRASNNLSQENLLKLIFGSLGALMGVFVAIGLILLYRKWDKKNTENIVHEEYVKGVKARVLPNTGAKWFDIGELEQATNNFSQKNLIGQGGFGLVYKGTLLDGTIVAVKQLIDHSELEGDEEFKNESEIISKIRHRNLLSLRGCCVSSDPNKGKRRFLVYDFMSNGSLDVHLFNRERSQLSWPQRKNIILDIAKGLNYLHNGIKPSIYHRDIKATNILLDSDMNARVSDFGLAKQSREGQTHLTTRVAGTYGYLAPEYALYGQLTDKSDVYSFGIIILEIMSGKKVLELDTSLNSNKVLVTDWAWEMVKSGNVKGVFDESMRENGPCGVMERFVMVGILCAHVMVALRPTVADALKMLEGDIDIPVLPDRPLPLSHESFRSSLHNSIFTIEETTARSSVSRSSMSRYSVSSI